MSPLLVSMLSIKLSRILGQYEVSGDIVCYHSEDKSLNLVVAPFDRQVANVLLVLVSLCSFVPSDFHGRHASVFRKLNPGFLHSQINYFSVKR